MKEEPFNVSETKQGMSATAAPLRLVMPFTTQPERHRGLENIKLLNANSTEVKGPSTKYREPHRVQQGPLTAWDADAARALSVDIGVAVSMWDYGWSEKESYWESEILNCHVPEEVEALVPTKWVGYRWDVEVDDTLSRVCSLCTSLVDRFIQLSQPSNGQADASASKWRLRRAMQEKLQCILDLFEATIGESIPMLKLRDAAYVKQCWERFGEDERTEAMHALQELQTLSLAP